MSDQRNNDGQNGDGEQHEAARRMAEAAIVAQEAGDIDRANALIDQAEKTDPEAVTEVVERMDLDAPIPSGTQASDDRMSDDVVSDSETVLPGSDAPSRAGITGSGSGADNQGL